VKRIAPQPLHVQIVPVALCMPRFNFYIMVDWSGAGRRRGNCPDSIWIAHGDIEDESPETVSPFSRTEAVQLIRELLLAQTVRRNRVLLCFDFAYGFPRDFAAALQTVAGKSDNVLPWRLIWEYFKSEITDDGGHVSSSFPNNHSNRFEVADKINSLLSGSNGILGPFWCFYAAARHPNIPQNRPSQPFQSAQGFSIPSLRFTDRRANSGTPFRSLDMGAWVVRPLREFHAYMGYVSPPNSLHSLRSGHSKLGGRRNLNGCLKTSPFCMPRFIRVFWSLLRTRSKIAGKSGRCGNGHGIKIARDNFGANSRALSKLILDHPKISRFS
jgi:hypothetical protein